MLTFGLCVPILVRNVDQPFLTLADRVPAGVPISMHGGFDQWWGRYAVCTKVLLLLLTSL